MKLHLSIAFLLITLTTYAAPTPTDTLKTKQLAFTKRLDSLSGRILRLQEENDSILSYYRRKEDFYVMAVDRQGSHFEWLLATVIGAAGLFSYTFFRRELDKINHLVEDQLNSIKEKSKKLEDDLSKTQMNTDNMVAALTFKSVEAGIKELKSNPKKVYENLNATIAGIGFIRSAYDLSIGEDDKEFAAHNLRVAFKTFISVLDIALDHKTNGRLSQEKLNEFEKDERSSIIRFKAYSIYISDEISSMVITSKQKLEALFS